MPYGPLHSITTTTGRRALYGAAAAGLLLFSLQGGAGQAASGYDWPQFDGNAAHSGDNTAESSLNTSNVHALTRLFHATLPTGAVADGAPAYLSAAATPGGTRDLIFLTTKDGRTLARDARTGGAVWEGGTSGPRYTTSSPAIDPGRQYVYGYGLDGYAHKYAAADGTEVKTGGWPELTTRKPDVEKGSSALTVATARSGVNYLYVTNGGYPGDGGDYQGHVTSINLTTGAQTVFNANCSDLTIHFVENGTTSGAGQNDCARHQTAIWAREGVVYDTSTDKIYMATGNGPFDANSSAAPNHDWGDTVFALHSDGSGTGVDGNPLDSYTPSNYQSLQNADADLGSTAPAILPTTSTGQHLAVQSGKDAKLRLLNLDNLSGQAGPRHLGGEVGAIIAVPQGGEVLTAPAVWVDPRGVTWVFVANGNGLSALQLTVTNGTPSLHTVWQRSGGRTSPIVANGVLYAAGNGIVEALDPTTGGQLWHDGGIGGIHWESPIVANGALYITDESGTLSAYALAATTQPTSTATTQPTVTKTAPASTASATTQATATRTNTVAPSATGTATTRPATGTPTATAGIATATGTSTATATTMATGTSTATATGTTTTTATATATPTASVTPTRTTPPTGTATATQPAATSTRTPPVTCRRKPSVNVLVRHGTVIGNGAVDVRVSAEPRTPISITLELTRRVVTIEHSIVVPAARHLAPYSSAQTNVASSRVPRRPVSHTYKMTRTVILYRTTVSAVTDQSGTVDRSIHIGFNPRRATAATLTVTVRTSCGKARRDVRVVVVPAPKQVKPRVTVHTKHHGTTGRSSSVE